MAKNWNFSISYRILFHYYVGQKSCRNRSISYGFWDINIFCFSQKFKMAAKSGENWNFSNLYIKPTLRVENSVEIALSLTVFEILTFFVFRKNSRWPPKVVKIEIFPFCIEYFSTTLRVQNSVEIALSLTVSEILANYSKVGLKIHNEVPKWLLLMYWQSYQCQMQYQASYGDNNLVSKTVVRYL